jgi:hypothetical protein
MRAGCASSLHCVLSGQQAGAGGLGVGCQCSRQSSVGFVCASRVCLWQDVAGAAGASSALLCAGRAPSLSQACTTMYAVCTVPCQSRVSCLQDCPCPCTALCVAPCVLLRRPSGGVCEVPSALGMPGCSECKVEWPPVCTCCAWCRTPLRAWRGVDGCLLCHDVDGMAHVLQRQRQSQQVKMAVAARRAHHTHTHPATLASCSHQHQRQGQMGPTGRGCPHRRRHDGERALKSTIKKAW